MRKISVVLAALVAAPAAAQDAAEVEVARAALAAIQETSFRKRREFCGYIGYDARGELVATDPVQGTRASCGAPYPDDLAVTASYHTHGAFDAGYFNELPSTVDVEGDMQWLLTGYVATPGGRFWHIDGREGIATLICGPACLPVAPGFYKGQTGDIADRYSIEELRLRLGD